MRIYPKPGVSTRDPVTKRLVPVTGLDVDETNSYWARRRRDGDVTETAPDAKADAAKSPSPAPAASTPAPAGNTGSND